MTRITYEMMGQGGYEMMEGGHEMMSHGGSYEMMEGSAYEMMTNHGGAHREMMTNEDTHEMTNGTHEMTNGGAHEMVTNGSDFEMTEGILQITFEMTAEGTFDMGQGTVEMTDGAAHEMTAEGTFEMMTDGSDFEMLETAEIEHELAEIEKGIVEQTLDEWQTIDEPKDAKVDEAKEPKVKEEEAEALAEQEEEAEALAEQEEALAEEEEESVAERGSLGRRGERLVSDVMTDILTIYSYVAPTSNVEEARRAGWVVRDRDDDDAKTVVPPNSPVVRAEQTLESEDVMPPTQELEPVAVMRPTWELEPVAGIPPAPEAVLTNDRLQRTQRSNSLRRLYRESGRVETPQETRLDESGNESYFFPGRPSTSGTLFFAQLALPESNVELVRLNLQLMDGLADLIEHVGRAYLADDHAQMFQDLSALIHRALCDTMILGPEPMQKLDDVVAYDQHWRFHLEQGQTLETIEGDRDGMNGHLSRTVDLVDDWIRCCIDHQQNTHEATRLECMLMDVAWHELHALPNGYLDGQVPRLLQTFDLLGFTQPACCDSTLLLD